MVCTKDRSIFSDATGSAPGTGGRSSRFRSRRSPTARPGSSSSVSAAATDSVSSTIALSVTSITRSLGSAPVVRSAAVTVEASPRPNWRGRRVHRDRPTAEPEVLPPSELSARLVDRPLAQRDDQIRALRHGDELAGQQETALGAPPSHERLGTDGAPRRQLDHGLVVDHQLTALDRVEERAFEVHALAGRRWPSDR